MEFGIPGYNNLVWDVSLVSDRIGSSTQHGLNGKLQFGDYLNAWARRKKANSEVTIINIAFASAILGNERFKWSRASTFTYNRNAIRLAVAYAAAIRTHLSVHDTAHPMSAASARPGSAADCLIRSAVEISHPRQQGNPPANLSVASDSVRSDIFIGLGTGTVGGDKTISLI